jgi:hypothetical protein
VTSHEAISAAVPVKPIDDTSKERQEVFVVVASDKEAVSPGRLPDDVVKAAGDKDARRASHTTNMPGGSDSPRWMWPFSHTSVDNSTRGLTPTGATVR